ncbi:restriction endonuclease subunit S [Candidatus Contendibacter odensensis]|uniref:Restriction endonuclease subunit S n=1 Tax=Candidatus Contendobacter odensis Run_B_J11 TaxID=1400861 RepID=A0A7U7G8V3_9GAMM|nr:restriction endonuclease subunit S [Candidatus Contendobacter odensis]CDH43621.1 hypothetical protein BN874_1260029 [Candidatus Contendobacter odensis Run_B_J11]
MPAFGLSDKTLTTIRQILADYPAVKKAILYGSRAKGNYKKGSDIDLALIGDALDQRILGEIAGRLEESPIPYQVDLSLWKQIDNQNLLEHIECVGVVFYERADRGSAIKSRWKTKTLGDIFQTGSGGTPLKSRKEYYENGSIPWLMSGEVSQGEVLKATNFITQKGLENSSAKIFPKNTVLVAMYGATAGQVGILRFEAATNQAVCGIFPNEYFVPEFLFYFLLSRKDELIAQAAGNAQPNISQLKVRNTEIPIVLLPEQQRIVGILDEAFDGIATAKANAGKNLKNARTLFESYLQSVFTQRGERWVDATIGQHIRFIDYRGKTPEKTEDGLRLITAKNVKMGYLQETPKEFVTPESYDGWMTRGIPKLGDVLFTTEAPLANVAQLDTGEKVVFAQRIIIMQPVATKLDSTFLKYLLLSQPIQQRIHDKGTGATVKGIKASLLKKIEISFPKSVAEQQRIVAKLDILQEQTQRLESIYRRKLAALDELKKSLLHQAFAGEL